jgi:preprotein translocase subunit YajC
MANLILAQGDVFNLILISGLIAVFLAFILWQNSRQRRAQADYMAMIDTLRIGTRVKMASGVIGRIKELREEAPGFKTVLIETGGGKNVSYLTYTLDAVQGIVNEEALAQLNAQAAAITPPYATPAEPEPAKEVRATEETFDAASYVGKRNAASKKKSKTDK